MVLFDIFCTFILTFLLWLLIVGCAIFLIIGLLTIIEYLLQ